MSITGTKRDGGFTLVEIIIVAAIVGILASIAIPNFAEGRRRASQNACKSNQKQLVSAIIAYNADWGSYPGDLQQLTPGYMKRLPNCPANRDYEYYYQSTTGDVGCAYDSSHNLYNISGGGGGGGAKSP